MSRQPGKQLAAVRQTLAELTYGQMNKLQHLDPLPRRVAPALERFNHSAWQAFRLQEYKENGTALGPDLPGGALSVDNSVASPTFVEVPWASTSSTLDAG